MKKNLDKKYNKELHNILEKTLEEKCKAISNLIEQLLKLEPNLIAVSSSENIITYYEQIQQEFLNTIRKIFNDNRREIDKYEEYCKNIKQNELSVEGKLGNILYMLSSLANLEYGNDVEIVFDKEYDVPPLFNFWHLDKVRSVPAAIINFPNLIYQTLNQININVLAEYFSYLNNNK